MLATGCASTAWVGSFYAVHNWMIARFPTETVDELYADRGYVLAPAALSPDGRWLAGQGSQPGTIQFRDLETGRAWASLGGVATLTAVRNLQP